MKKVLVINSSARGLGSRSRKLTEIFVDRWKGIHINPRISFRELGNMDVPHVSESWTVLPPLLFTRGMPLTGMGLGAIIAFVEIPVAILTANVLLKEPVSLLQWLGAIFFLLAVVLMNIGKKIKYI